MTTSPQLTWTKFDEHTYYGRLANRDTPLYVVKQNDEAWMLRRPHELDDSRHETLSDAIGTACLWMFHDIERASARFDEALERVQQRKRPEHDPRDTVYRLPGGRFNAAELIQEPEQQRCGGCGTTTNHHTGGCWG